MKLRFSLRWLLVGVTALSVLLYVGFIHPTLVAERFIRSIESHDYRQLDPICPLTKEGWLTDWMFGTRCLSDCDVKVHLQPQSWDDLWKLRRVLWIDLIHKSKSSSWWYASSSASQLPYYEAISVGLFGLQRLELQQPPEASNAGAIEPDEPDEPGLMKSLHSYSVTVDDDTN